MSPVPALDKITQIIYSLYAKYGLMDNLTLVLNALYISAKGHGSPDPIMGETKVSGNQGRLCPVRPFCLCSPYPEFCLGAGCSSILDGCNIGKANYFNICATYSFDTGL